MADPLGLGVIGILGLGSLAALVFAAIGFLVSVSVSTTERLGELALLKALGLAPRQLLAWLSVENVALLVVGLVVGVLLGLLLAWLALPFATLTPRARRPCPAPVVVVPLEALLPTPACWASCSPSRRSCSCVASCPAARTSTRPAREGRVAMGWTRLALRRLRDDRAATLGLALLVLVTALLAALAPRVIAGLADSAVQAEVASATASARNIALLQDLGIAAGPAG